MYAALYHTVYSHHLTFSVSHKKIAGSAENCMPRCQQNYNPAYTRDTCYITIFHCAVKTTIIFTVQWNLSWETTAITDHLSWDYLSWKANNPGRKFYISMHLNLSPKTTCLERPDFYRQWGGLRELYCIGNFYLT